MQKPPPLIDASVTDGEGADTIGKAFKVMRCFVDGQAEWGVRELAAVLKQPTSSVHRLLKILRREGYLTFDPAVQRYRIGLEFVRVASVVAKRTQLGPIALPIMRKLSEQTGESVWLAEFDRDRHRIVYLAENSSAHVIRIPAPIGYHAPLDADVAGRAILSSLHQAPDAGVGGEPPLGAGYRSEITSDHDPIVKIAVAVHDATHSPVGALVLALPQHRLAPRTEFALARLVSSAAAQLSQRLGARILGGGTSGSWHDGVGIIAALLSRNSSGLELVPSLGGGARNITELQEGRGAYCITTLASALARTQGHPSGSRTERLRLVANLSHLDLHIIVRKGVAFSSIEDAKHLRVSPGLSDFSSFQLFHQLLELEGIRPKDIKSAGGQIVEFDFAEAGRQLAAARIDVIFALIVGETSVFRDVVEQHGAKVVGLEPATLARLLDEHSAYRRTELPAGLYKGQRTAISTVRVDTLLLTTQTRSDSEVYDVVSTLIRHRDDLVAASPSYAGFGLASASKAQPLPFHPGAARFWQEMRSSDEPSVRPKRRSKAQSHKDIDG